MILKRIKMNVGAIMGENCYIIQDEKTKETMIIDPGNVSEHLTETLDAMQVKMKYILLTHCHGDHIGGVQKIKEKYGGKILIHRIDAIGLKDININLSTHIGLEPVILQEDARIDDGDLLHVGDLEFKVIYTPGHTAGSISLYCEKEKMLFSGDTLFRGSWGRTDLPTSSFDDIITSITNKLINLPDDTIVYPGHRKINNN
jgi:hydroxyacylglutathione hydrolase